MLFRSAFTGNKFEFRAPGSSQSCSEPNVVLNTIVAEAFDMIAEQLEKLDDKNFHTGLQKILQKIVKEHKRVLYNGNGYTDEWVKEAERRGLPNIRTSLEALKALTKDENVELFEKYGVMNRREMLSRYEINVEDFHKRIHIEGEVARDLAKNVILPKVVEAYEKSLRTNEMALNQGFPGLDTYVKSIGEGCRSLTESIAALEASLEGEHEGIIAAVAGLRKVVDGLEKVVPDEMWPLPKYREMLFIY